MYFLLLAKAETVFLVFVDSSMFGYMKKEKELGRVPPHVELLLLSNLPSELAKRLLVSQKAASEEVSPN